jgi:FkbM family methyltransferase
MFTIFKFFYFAYKKYFEDPYYHFCKTHPEIFKNGHVLDVGANIGYTSSVFASMISDKYKVFSFEPELNNYNSLLRLTLKKASRIEAVHSAVGSTSGTCTLALNKDHHADHSVHILDTKNPIDTFQTVPMVSLDDFVDQRPGTIDKIVFVKIDVQGFELEVLKGMTRIMERSKNLVISLEIAGDSLEKYDASANDIFNFLKIKGFHGGIIKKKGKVVPLTTETINSYYDVVFFRDPTSFQFQSR